MSSLGGNMNYIYGNTLVLGDSSYLEHHGIKNQKWGVRRFQNPDGSLTAAGRIRYGVTGAAKAAFKVGKKLGSATASAAKAGVKKAKDNAYAKKKEKASQTREGVLKNKKMFTNEELKRLEERFKIEDDMRNAGLRHGQEIAKTISAYGDAAVKTMNALQTGGKAVKAISDGLSALKDYKEKLDIDKKASDAGTKAKTSEKTSNKPPNDDNPPNDGGGAGSKKQAEDEAKRKADLDSRESDLKQREDYVNTRYDALLKVSKQRQSEQDARDEDLNRRDKAASEREAKLKETAKTAADVMSKLKKRQADLDKKESFLNSIESYRLDTLSEFKKNEEEAARRKKKNARHSAIGEEMYTDHLEHHGIKGQRWGVRRFQNADGSLTDKGRKHYQKKLALEERKLTAANAARGKYERVRTPMTVGMAVIGAVAGAMAGVPAGPAGIAAGAAVVSSIAASSTYAEYTLKGVFAGHGANRSKKKIAKYTKALAQDAFEIQNGVLIYGSGKSRELEHFGLKGMKWGVRRFQNKDGSLTDAGKKRYSNTGELDGGGGGGGSDEEDEETKKKIEEAAKKAGMTVDEYRKKFADKIEAVKKKDTSWKYDSSISTKDMRRSAKESAEFAESVSKKAHESAMAQNSALRAGDKKRAKTHGWAATEYNALARDEQMDNRYSAKNMKRNYDSTLEGKATKLKYVTQRAKQRVYNAAGGKYKEQANKARAYKEREKAKENRAIKNGNQYDAEAARSWYDLYSQSEKDMNSAYKKSIAGRYYALKAKRKKKSASHAAFIEDGTLYLEHHGIKGQRWGVRRFQNPDGTRTEAGKKRDAKIAAKASKYRNKDISRYDVEIAKAKDPDQKYRYEQLRKHTENLSDREIIAQQRYSRAVATGEGIVAAVSVSLGLGMPNIGSIAIGAAVARSIAKTTRDNYRVRSINAERTQESVRREYEDLINHDAFIEDGTLYLAHHGILGQKWGVRRFQDVAGRLTAAGKQHIQEAKKKLGNAGAKYKTSSVETQQTDVVPGGGAAEDWDDFDDESLNYYMDYLLSLSDDQLSALGLKRSDLKKATSRDDKYKIVLALKKIDSTSPKVVRVLNSMLTALFSSDLTKTLEPAKLTGDVLFAKMREHAAAKRRESEEIDPKTGFHIKSDRNSSMETDVRNVNPGFTNLSDNTKNNCMLCTTAYDLRRRGYDVNAERISSGLQTTDVKRYYPDAEVRQVTGATTTAELNQKTKEALISQGEGARGNLMVTWQGGAGGHSMAYEVHNGEVKIYDGQSGEVHETEEIIAYTTAVSYARLDNVEPDWDRIKEAVR